MMKRKSAVADLSEGLTRATPGAYRWLRWALAVLCLITISLVLATGVPVLTMWGHDFFLPFDGAWRVYQGQVPHKDFYSPFGFLNFIIIDLGMMISSPSPMAIVVASALLSAVVAAWSWGLLRSWMHPVLAFVLSLYAALLTCGECALGQNYRRLSEVSILNRYVAGLFMVFLAATLTTSHFGSQSKRRVWFEGLSAGALFTILFFLKLNFFILGGVALVLVAFMKSRHREWWKSFALGFIVTGFLALLYLRFDMAALFHDYYFAVRSKTRSSLGVNGEGSFIERLLNPFPHEMTVVNFLATTLAQYREIVTLAVLVWIVRGYSWRLIIIAVLFGTASIASNLGNFQVQEITGLIFLAGFLVSDVFKQAPKRHGQVVAAFIAFGVVIFPWIYNNAASLIYASYVKSSELKNIPEAYHLRSEVLGDLIILENTRQCKTPYGERFRDGTELLRKFGLAPQRIAVFDFANPFTSGLGLPPARNFATNLGVPLGFNADEAVPEKLFSDVNIVLIPKCPDLPYATATLVRRFSSFIEMNYKLRDQSQYWYVLGRP